MFKNQLELILLWLLTSVHIRVIIVMQKFNNLTHRWLDRCINQFKDTPANMVTNKYFFQLMSSTFEDLRKESADLYLQKLFW